MIALGLLFLRLPCDRFKPRQQLEAEILVLRHQLNILHRARGRPHLRWVDRALFIWLYRRCPRILNAITVVRPETILRWHRMGYACVYRKLKLGHNGDAVRQGSRRNGYFQFVELGARMARPYLASDAFAIHYNRRHTRLESGAGALRPV
jgi:hypothetical protein